MKNKNIIDRDNMVPFYKKAFRRKRCIGSAVMDYGWESYVKFKFKQIYLPQFEKDVKHIKPIPINEQ